MSSDIKHPVRAYCYAVTTGKYAGEMLVYIQESSDDLSFLSIPKMSNREIPKDKFKVGIDSKIIDIVEKLPSDVYRTCISQFEKNKKTGK